MSFNNKKHHRKQRLNSGFCLSLLEKSRRFVTSDYALKRVVRLLPDSSQHINADRHILIRGSKGVGKKTLVLHCWRLLQRGQRPLVRKRCRFIKKTTQLQRHIDNAHGGDLFLDNIDTLAKDLLFTLPKLIEDNDRVRVIATSEGKQLSANLPSWFFTIDVPCLTKRPGDCRLLADYLLKHRFHKQVAVRLLDDLLVRKKITSTRDLYIILVNLILVCELLGKENLDKDVLNTVLHCSDEELVHNYFIFLTNKSGLYQMVDDYGLKNTCRLSEYAYIASSMLETGYNQSLASQMLHVPETTLSNKKLSLPLSFLAS